jgi:hypothetical protein
MAPGNGLKSGRLNPSNSSIGNGAATTNGFSGMVRLSYIRHVYMPSPSLGPRSAPSSVVVGVTAGLGGLVVGTAVAVLVSRRMFAFKKPSSVALANLQYE